MPALIYAIPLTAIISVVYSATRYELPEKIFRSALTMFVKTVIALAILYGLLWYLSS